MLQDVSQFFLAHSDCGDLARRLMKVLRLLLIPLPKLMPLRDSATTRLLLKQLLWQKPQVRQCFWCITKSSKFKTKGCPLAPIKESQISEYSPSPVCMLA